MRTGSLYRGEKCVVPTVWHAASPWTRLRGLLGRRPLQPQAAEGLLIEPCASVHTFWMTYSLDLVFLDRNDRVLNICENVTPWSARTARGARKTLELAAGSLMVFQPRIGEELIWRIH
jgi:uncharacterized membrane protein (UPF0127 family)